MVSVPSSSASKMSSRSISLVSDAGANASRAFCSKSSWPVCCSISRTDFAVKLIATWRFSSSAKAGMLPAASRQRAKPSAQSRRRIFPIFFIQAPSLKKAFFAMYMGEGRGL